LEPGILAATAGSRHLQLIGAQAAAALVDIQVKAAMAAILDIAVMQVLVAVAVAVAVETIPVGYRTLQAGAELVFWDWVHRALAAPQVAQDYRVAGVHSIQVEIFMADCMAAADILVVMVPLESYGVKIEVTHHR